MKRLLFIGLPVVIGLVALYFFVMLNWNYSSGERAGWVQKFSKRGWICKTWEGELAMVSMPGAAQEKFYFTVWDEDVARRINETMGRRVSLHYQEKVGLPTTCFGETLYWVDDVTIVPEIPLAPGIVAPVAPGDQTIPPQQVPQQQVPQQPMPQQPMPQQPMPQPMPQQMPQQVPPQPMPQQQPAPQGVPPVQPQVPQQVPPQQMPQQQMAPQQMPAQPQAPQQSMPPAQLPPQQPPPAPQPAPGK